MAEDLACSACQQQDRPEAMLICDGECGRGFHTDCVGLDCVPDGDWFCHDCRQLRVARAFLHQRGLLERSKWLTPGRLPFSVGDFVVALYPAVPQAEMAFGLVQKLDARCSQFPDRYAVLLQWWPFAPRRAYPYFAAVPCSTTVWEEQQEFWPLLRALGRRAAADLGARQRVPRFRGVV